MVLAMEKEKGMGIGFAVVWICIVRSGNGSNKKVTLGPSSGGGGEGSCQENWRKSVPGRGNSSCKSPVAGGHCGWCGRSWGRGDRPGNEKEREVWVVPLKDSEFDFK